MIALISNQAGAFEKAVKGASGFIHTATPVVSLPVPLKFMRTFRGFSTPSNNSPRGFLRRVSYNNADLPGLEDGVV